MQIFFCFVLVRERVVTRHPLFSSFLKSKISKFFNIHPNTHTRFAFLFWSTVFLTLRKSQMQKSKESLMLMVVVFSTFFTWSHTMDTTHDKSRHVTQRTTHTHKQTHVGSRENGKGACLFPCFFLIRWKLRRRQKKPRILNYFRFYYTIWQSEIERKRERGDSAGANIFVFFFLFDLVGPVCVHFLKLFSTQNWHPRSF